jgi:chromosome segregation ATPase
MTEEDKLRKKIEDLEKELETKNKEMMKNLDKIDHLEEELMTLHDLIPEKSSKKKRKKVKDSKHYFELAAKDREIRDLKDKLGFLRIEKIQAEKELEKIRINEKASSSVIRVEDIRKNDRPPLSILVKELQGKIKKQESLIKRLKGGTYSGEDYEEKLEEKNDEINSLKKDIETLKQQLKESASIPQPKPDKDVKKKLLEELQDKLNKSKRQIDDLNEKLNKYEQREKSKEKEDPETAVLKAKIVQLTDNLMEKNAEIDQLKKAYTNSETTPQTNPLEPVVEELKSKLNKAKSQIDLLKFQLNDAKEQPEDSKKTGKKDVDGRLKIQREMARLLQQQLDEANIALKTKEEEIGTIKNEAIRIKNKYEELYSQIRQKDQQVSDLKAELDKVRFQAHNQVTNSYIEDPQLIVRINELKSLVDELNKQNAQQRLEISQLRKST